MLAPASRQCTEHRVVSNLISSVSNKLQPWFWRSGSQNQSCSLGNLFNATFGTLPPPSPSTYFKLDQAQPNCIWVFWHLNKRGWFPMCWTIRNKEMTFLHKPPARLFSESTFDHWRLDGLGTGPITSKWNIELPFFPKAQPPFKGGGIFKCSPACQLVYILLLEKSQHTEAAHNEYSMTSRQRQFKEILCGSA